ncbi:LysM peptidoglycan-binding domain-containing protein [Aliamphritea hakodatensis]|uniref:LysM peptidoglycan-binding domain-containing protein n=1 Tax=Aliamphritea hakodatensis TaxID=2895352 RepID=UPI0022FD4CD4|nr:LysM domain-containing protein [Aliamphritea hakodatensis]
MRRFISGLLCLCLAGWLMMTPATAADNGDILALKKDYPKEYIVVKGDTLWDISALFLQSPWKWPELWGFNPQIDNPHLIYPGDRLTLVWINGKPRLQLSKGIRKLSPKAKVSLLDDAIPAIHLKDIGSFLSEHLVKSSDTLLEAPYILGSTNNRLVAGAGDRVYARGELVEDYHYQNVYRPAREFIDPDTEESLGFELRKVGEASVFARKEDIISLDLLETNEEISSLDRVFPSEDKRVTSTYYPSEPEGEINGRILSVVRGVKQAGQYDVVAINKGTREGLATGHVLSVYTVGELLIDPVTKEPVTLPAEKSGLMMIFSPFEKVSYALILKATNVIAVGDEVRNPE